MNIEKNATYDNAGDNVTLTLYNVTPAPREPW